MATGNILMGVIGKPHGVKGLLHVHSFTAEPADLASYSPLIDDRGAQWSLTWRAENIAELRDAAGKPVADRNAAEKLVNLRLYAPRERLPQTGPDEFYLADLEGLLAVGPDGTQLGRVTAVLDYGAGASLEIQSETETLLIPFTRDCVPVVDVPGGQVTVLPPDELEVRELEVRDPEVRDLEVRDLEDGEDTAANAEDAA